MKIKGSILSLIIFSGAVIPLSLFSPADFAASALLGNSYESMNQLPNLSGLWEISRGGAFNTNTQPSLTPEYAAQAQAYASAQARGDIEDSPAANCVPPGLPNNMRDPYPIEILLTPGKVTIILEAYSQWRQVFTDGRGHPEDPDFTFSGHSTGSWTNDSLLVETVGLSTETAMARNFGVRHSDKMRIVERFWLEEPDLLVIETTVHDTEALIEPWVNLVSYARHSDWTLAEYVCQQNNRNYTTEDGKAGINLEFRPE